MFRQTTALSVLFLILFPLVARAQDTRPSDTHPAADNDVRVVRVYDEAAGEWREYPYPETAVAGADYMVQTRSDGSILLFTGFYHRSEYSREIDPEGALLLNPATGEFTIPETMCGTIRALPGEGRWMVYTDMRVNRSAICNHETGQLLGLVKAYTSIETSPDGEWVVSNLDGGEYPHHYFDFYSYEVATGHRNYLGRIVGSVGSRYVGSRWMGEHQWIYVYGEGLEGISDEYYVMDVNQPGSLQFITRGWPEFYDDPPRLEYLETCAFLQDKTGSICSNIPCTFTLYDGSGVYTYQLGYDCSLAKIFRADADHYYYLRFESDPALPSTLVRMNVHTGEFDELISGEFESFWIGDGYVALRQDANGRIDLINQYLDPYDLALGIEDDVWDLVPDAKTVFVEINDLLEKAESDNSE